MDTRFAISEYNDAADINRQLDDAIVEHPQIHVSRQVFSQKALPEISSPFHQKAVCAKAQNLFPQIF